MGRAKLGAAPFNSLPSKSRRKILDTGEENLRTLMRYLDKQSTPGSTGNPKITGVRYTKAGMIKLVSFLPPSFQFVTMVSAGPAGSGIRLSRDMGREKGCEFLPVVMKEGSSRRMGPDEGFCGFGEILFPESSLHIWESVGSEPTSAVRRQNLGRCREATPRRNGPRTIIRPTRHTPL